RLNFHTGDLLQNYRSYMTDFRIPSYLNGLVYLAYTVEDFYIPKRQLEHFMTGYLLTLCNDAYPTSVLVMGRDMNFVMSRTCPGHFIYSIPIYIYMINNCKIASISASSDSIIMIYDSLDSS